MEAWRCPNCDASTVIPGQVRTGEGAGFGFLPNGMRRGQTGIPMTLGFLSCWSCGHVWGSLAPDKLHAFIEEQGKELARQYRDAVEHGSNFGLPDYQEAIEAAQGVSEIDALVLAWREREAGRRFRQLTHTTWDQTLEAIRGWHDLARATKLAMLGWSPKENSLVEKSAMLDHPLRNRLLDG